MRYDWIQVKGPRKNELICTNKENTCERATCECDRLFSLGLEEKINDFDKQYHVFWSETGWNPEENCKPRISNSDESSKSKCCGSPKTGPFKLYRDNLQMCCDDEVMSIGSC